MYSCYFTLMLLGYLVLYQGPLSSKLLVTVGSSAAPMEPQSETSLHYISLHETGL